MELLIVTSLVGALVWAILRSGEAPKQQMPTQSVRCSRSEEGDSVMLHDATDEMPLSGDLTKAEQDQVMNALAQNPTEHSHRSARGSKRTVRASTRLFSGCEEDEAAKAIRRALRK